MGGVLFGEWGSTSGESGDGGKREEQSCRQFGHENPNDVFFSKYFSIHS